MKVPENASQEAFYARLWTDREGSSKARAEERVRWEAIRRMVEAHVLPTAGGRPMEILDLGCGRGWLTLRLSHWGAVLGIDPLDASVASARRRFPDLRFARATSGELLAQGFARRFDLIVSSEVIEHVPRDEQLGFVQDGARLLADGGRWILTTPRGELWSAWMRVPRRLQPIEEWLTEDALDRLAVEAGLRVHSRARAHLPRRSPTWQGRLLRSLFDRRPVRGLPLGPVRRRLEHAARLHQVVLLARQG